MDSRKIWIGERFRMYFSNSLFYRHQLIPYCKYIPTKLHTEKRKIPHSCQKIYEFLKFFLTEQYWNVRP